MNRGPSLFELVVDALTTVTLIAWEHAHRARVTARSLHSALINRKP